MVNYSSNYNDAVLTTHLAYHNTSWTCAGLARAKNSDKWKLSTLTKKADDSQSVTDIFSQKNLQIMIIDDYLVFKDHIEQIKTDLTSIHVHVTEGMNW